MKYFLIQLVCIWIIVLCFALFTDLSADATKDALKSISKIGQAFRGELVFRD